MHCLFTKLSQQCMSQTKTNFLQNIWNSNGGKDTIYLCDYMEMKFFKKSIFLNCGHFTASLWMLIVHGWPKILKNITRGSGHHLWKYWTYHSWPSATRDKSNIFTRDDQNHSKYFPIFLASHILLSQYSIILKRISILNDSEENFELKPVCSEY